MPNANKGATPQELITAVSLALQKVGLRRAMGDYSNMNDPLYRVQSVAAGVTPSAPATDHEYIIIDFNRVLLDSSGFGFEAVGMQEEPPRNSFPA